MPRMVGPWMNSDDPKGRMCGEPRSVQTLYYVPEHNALTGAASRVLMHHAERFQPLSEKQKALRKGRRGCLDSLAIDQAISK